uniref:Uncharacterized protein n=1 Tax=Arundo donax TaxID=35708 RepID=A0A0A9F1E2_ARUDO
MGTINIAVNAPYLKPNYTENLRNHCKVRPAAVHMYTTNLKLMASLLAD